MELFRTVTVHTGRPYDILVGQGLLEQLPARLEQLEGRRPKLAIVTDSHVDPLYGQQLLERLRRFGERYRVPVAYCDDFGHGDNHAVIPIGRTARLDTAGGGLTYIEEP